MQGHHPLEGREEGCVMWITSPSFGEDREDSCDRLLQWYLPENF